MKTLITTVFLMIKHNSTMQWTDIFQPFISCYAQIIERSQAVYHR